MADTTAVVDVPRNQKQWQKSPETETPSTNEANILAEKLSQATPLPSPMEADDNSKENHDGLSGLSFLPREGKGQSKPQSLEKDLQEMQEMLREKEKRRRKKRPSPPYILWCKDQWNEVKKGNPEADFKEVSNILGAKWKTITTEEKKPMKEISGREGSLSAVFAVQRGSGEGNKEDQERKGSIKAKATNVSVFLVLQREEGGSSGGQQEHSRGGQNHRRRMEEHDGGTKRTYEEMAKKNKEKYMQEMEVYKQRKKEEAESVRKEEEEIMKLQKQEALQLLKKKEKTENIIKKTKEEKQKKKQQQQRSDPNKPKKPASSFILFSKEARKSLMQESPGINNSTVNAMISVKWRYGIFCRYHGVFLIASVASSLSTMSQIEHLMNILKGILKEYWPFVAFISVMLGWLRCMRPSRALLSNELLLVPTITKNLLSASKLARDNHVFFEFHAMDYFVSDEVTKERGGGLYSFTLSNRMYKCKIAEANNVTSAFDSFELWHRSATRSGVYVHSILVLCSTDSCASDKHAVYKGFPPFETFSTHKLEFRAGSKGEHPEQPLRAPTSKGCSAHVPNEASLRDSPVGRTSLESLNNSTTADSSTLILDAAADVVWVEALLTDLGVHEREEPVVWCDNTSAVALCVNPMYLLTQSMSTSTYTL
ncbi:HMG box protein isoform 2 [Hibiscus syriacus]|uniref:HMG box protein isoform 2 n=1 Tax=Hibiscus syriacus TaxID=106335 RepID=A0A6A3C018_HIBSY|nr:HMG box protein isoform 2 [Hibiscus syriacus]